MSVNGELLWHTTWCVLVCGLVTLVAFRWSLEYGVLYGILLLFIGYILFRSGHTLGADDEFRDSEPSRETGSAVQESSATRAINQEERRPPPDKDHLLKLLQQGVSFGNVSSKRQPIYAPLFSLPVSHSKAFFSASMNASTGRLSGVSHRRIKHLSSLTINMVGQWSLLALFAWPTMNMGTRSRRRVVDMCFTRTASWNGLY